MDASIQGKLAAIMDGLPTELADAVTLSDAAKSQDRNAAFVCSSSVPTSPSAGVGGGGSR